MSSIHHLPSSNFATNGRPPYDGDMEARVSKLEVGALDTRDRLIKIESAMATKEDLLRLEVKLHQELNAQTWRLIGAMITFGGLLCAATFFIARNVH